MRSLASAHTSKIIVWLRKLWQGAVGIHTHEYMGMVLHSSMHDLSDRDTWLDATVTGMGRGPGNAKTEYLTLELAAQRNKPCNLVPLMNVIRKYFRPLQQTCGWGTNTYYYLAGKYGIHPTYIQEMLGDARYS